MNNIIKVREILDKTMNTRYTAEPVGHHELGRHYVYSVKDQKGKEYILKVYGKEGRWCTEVTTLRLLNEFVFSPEVIDHGVLKDGTEWLLLKKIEGFILDEIWGMLDFQDKERILKKMGEQIGLIHSIFTYDYFGPWPQCRKDKKNFYNLLEFRKNNDNKVIEQIMNQDLPEKDLFLETYTALKGFYETIDDCTTPRLCHRDYSGRNVIVNQQDGVWNIVGLIDFEHSQPDDPVIDFTSLYKCIFLDEARLKDSFFRGYGTYMELPSNFEDKMNYYLLNAGLNICCWSYKTANNYYKEGIDLLKKVMKRL